MARIEAARAALGTGDTAPVLVARCEAYLLGAPDPAVVTNRLVRFAAAGAECVYAPGITDPDQITTLVRAVAPVAVNVLLRPGMRVAQLAALGVRRVSVGGALAARAWAAFDAAAADLAREGVHPLA